MSRLMTVGEEKFLHDVARVLREAPTESRGVDTFVRLEYHIVLEWIRRFEEIAGEKP